jgi:ribosomal protein S12 methylthiotransferase accessory factor
MKPIRLLNDERPVRARHRFSSLVQPLTGIVEHVNAIPVERAVPNYHIGTAMLGNLTMTHPNVLTSRGTDVRDEPLGGASADVDKEDVWVKAAVEAIERYSTSVYSEDELRVATPAELGASAVDMQRIPRCSARELADPRAYVRGYDGQSAIRWIRGWSLVDRCERWVPAALAHLYYRPLPSESFTIQITTGVAAHTSLVTSLVSGLNEVIERDAIALTWLARLPLPRIDIEGLSDADVPASLRETLALYRTGLVKQAFFDATTDVGVPTVWAVQLAPGSGVEVVVSCATSFDPGVAVATCMREAVSCRVVLAAKHEVPERVEDYTDLLHGAVHYARGGHNADFDFLMESAPSRTLADVGRMAGVDSGLSYEGQLAYQVERLRALGMDAIAVDLTTDEVRDAGLWITRVIVPELLPISFIHRSRYLATPRLYSYPRRFGIELTEADVNPNPLPFA